MKTPTLDEFKTWAKAHHAAALAVVAAQAFAIAERKRVNEYIRPIFDCYHFVIGDIGREERGKKITNPENLYLCEDEALVSRYYAECDKAHRTHGFKGEFGYCPALIAENNRNMIEHDFLLAGCSLFDLDHVPYLMEHRKQMLNLLLGACFVKENKAA